MASTIGVKNSWGARSASWLLRIGTFLASGRALIMICLLFLLLGGWLAYRNVIAPLRSVSSLPPGVLERSPILEEGLLTTINSQRIKRVDSARQSFVVDALFQPIGRRFDN